jgi:hypothetical protein
MISAATNDAVFEVDLITGESWNNQALLIFRVLGAFQVGKTIVLYGGLGCTLMIGIE